MKSTGTLNYDENNSYFKMAVYFHQNVAAVAKEAGVEQLVTDLRPEDNAKMLSFSETKSEYYTHLKTPAEFIKTGFKEYDRWAHYGEGGSSLAQVAHP